MVESDLAQRLAYAQTLALAGHGVDLAGSAEEAWARLERAPVDVVVTDLALPGVNGELFALSLKHGFPHVGLVALAGRDSPSIAARCGYARIDVLGRAATATPAWLDRAVRTAAARRALRRA